MCQVSALTVGTSLVTQLGYSFSDPKVIGLYAVFVASLPIFVWVENHAAAPVLPMSILGRLQPASVFGAFMFQTATLTGRVRRSLCATAVADARRCSCSLCTCISPEA